MIALKKVSLQIKEVQILREIDVEFADGQIHGIVGRNGSGKTMLMKCICGFIPVTKGRIVVEGYGFSKRHGTYYRNTGLYSVLQRIKKPEAAGRFEQKNNGRTNQRMHGIGWPGTKNETGSEKV